MPDLDFNSALLYAFVPVLVLMYGVRAIWHNAWLNIGPEAILGIGANLHHDLVGIIFLLFGCILYLRTDQKWAAGLVIGAGAALLIEHLWFEGLVLVSAI